MLQEAKDIQQNAVKELLEKISLKNEVTFRAPTGSGKTRMMADFMNRILQKEQDVIFLVSSLSKGNLAEQNYNVFKECSDKNIFPNLNVYLISSESSGEEQLFIPNGYNVYVLARDLYKKNSRLKDGGTLLNFLQQTTHNLFGNGENKRIWLIKDECHQATKNLDELKESFFEKVINFSATPKLSRKQIPDVEITNEMAEQVKLIKHVELDNEEYLDEKERGRHPEIAIQKFEEVREKYVNLLGVNPCLIIQISNKEKGEEEWIKIEKILNQKEFQHLKWMSIVDKKEKCKTNDKVGKLPVERWKDYVKGNTSTIDIIVFKMVISEGWDIPRACMLYQVRDTKSKQLDEQVMGRVRRNPRLKDFEKLSLEAQKLAMTAWIWGIPPISENKTCQVKLFGNETDIPNAIKIKTTRLKSLSKRKEFDVRKFLTEKSKYDVTHKSIFELYRNLQKYDNSIHDLCYEFADSPHKWWKFCEHLDVIQKEYENFICDYNESMEVVKNIDGSDVEVSFPLSSSFVDNGNYGYIGDWVWKHAKGKSEQFSFDSESEQEWASILKDVAQNHVPFQEVGKLNLNALQMRLDNTTEPKRLTEEKKKLWGKNYPRESEIKYEYFLHGIHFSYPDFVMKDNNGKIHLFEVKSVNVSNKALFDSYDYKEKIEALKLCYKYCSEKTGHLFYLPIKKENDWQIFKYDDGQESTLNKEMFIQSFEKN